MKRSQGEAAASIKRRTKCGRAVKQYFGAQNVIDLLSRNSIAIIVHEIQSFLQECRSLHNEKH